MKNKILLFMLSLSAVACTPVAQLYTDTTDKLGLTPAYARTAESVSANSFYPPAGTLDGAFSTQSSNGRTLKGTVHNSVFVGTVEIYHPNGKLHSRTPMQNGKPEGLSQGYTEDGKLRTEILYQNGRAVHFKRFNTVGKVEAEGNL